MDNKDTLARTLYGEAEAYNSSEALAIGWVIKNRVKRANWPDTIAEVCVQPLQFSCWNSNDPNRARILSAKGSWFVECNKIADNVIMSLVSDPTNGATHYYCDNVKEPAWARGHTPCYRVSHSNGSSHLFFNDIDTKPPVNAAQALDQTTPLSETRTMKNVNTAAGATALGMLAPAVTVLTPTIPLLQTIAQYAPYVLGMIALAAIIGIAWARIEDRNKGLR